MAFGDTNQKNINTILIANRGEIASRIIRTCQKMGIRSIAVYSDADKSLPYVREATRAVHIGEPEPTSSYLDQDKIIRVAKLSGADAIHPGYGFLSENAAFADECEKEGIIFIGPNSNAIRAMGSKSEAKTLMKKFDVPTIPGYQGSDQSKDRLIAEAEKIGFPLLLKATAGGGGKGMRIVHQSSELNQAIDAAKREAKNAFGDDELIIEKYISQGRHVEFQIFGDKHGHTIHVLERECSIQRRYQKVIEESPSPIMTDELRSQMGASAVAAAKALNYDNAGTVEFIYDDVSGDYYFLEVNTRLQVEHPVTEEITGLDLVEMQIESAQGLPLSVSQEEIKGKGYAIEVRLYAEDASNQFLPVSGKIQKWDVPYVHGLRVETAIETGAEISIYYDPMIAKLIVWDKNRIGAMRKMEYVLRNLVCMGMTTNQDFLLLLLQNELFRQGEYDTHFIDKKIDLKTLEDYPEHSKHLACIASNFLAWKKRKSERKLLKGIPSGWRNNFYAPQSNTFEIKDEEFLLQYKEEHQRFLVEIGDEKYDVKFVQLEENRLSLEINGEYMIFKTIRICDTFYIHNESVGNIEVRLQARFPIKEIEKEKGTYLSPMPSQVIQILVEKGQTVKSGDGLIVLSSMKMENLICAEEDGEVQDIFVSEGENIDANYTLLKVVNQ